MSLKFKKNSLNYIQSILSPSYKFRAERFAGLPQVGGLEEQRHAVSGTQLQNKV